MTDVRVEIDVSALLRDERAVKHLCNTPLKGGPPHKIVATWGCPNFTCLRSTMFHIYMHQMGDVNCGFASQTCHKKHNHPADSPSLARVYDFAMWFWSEIT